MEEGGDKKLNKNVGMGIFEFQVFKSWIWISSLKKVSKTLIHIF